jgi:hypothetical protein
MNGQENQKTCSLETETKREAAEIRARQKAEGNGPKSAGRAAGEVKNDAGAHGCETKQRRRETRKTIEARAVDDSKIKAREKLAQEIKALENLKSLV